MVALLFNIGVFFLPIDYGAFGRYAYLGVFLITLIANATVIIPVPYPAVIARVATQADSLALVILAGALGSVLGESVAFFVGRSGRGAVEDTRFYRWVQRQMRHPWRAFALLFGSAAGLVRVRMLYARTKELCQPAPRWTSVLGQHAMRLWWDRRNAQPSHRFTSAGGAVTSLLEGTESVVAGLKNAGPLREVLQEAVSSV